MSIWVLLIQATLLQKGFNELRQREDPRKRAELLRYIEKMDQKKVSALLCLMYSDVSTCEIDEVNRHETKWMFDI